MDELVLCEGLRIDFRQRYNLDIFSEYGKQYPERKGAPTSSQLGDFSAARETEENATIDDLFQEWQDPIVDFGGQDEDSAGHEDWAKDPASNFFDACGLNEEVNIIFYYLIIRTTPHPS